MALSLNKVLPSGVTASYFRVKSAHLDVVSNSLIINVDVFLTASACTGGCSSLSSQSYSPASQDTATILAAAEFVTGIYTYLKTLPEFAGAVDVA